MIGRRVAGVLLAVIGGCAEHKAPTGAAGPASSAPVPVLVPAPVPEPEPVPVLVPTPVPEPEPALVPATGDCALAGTWEIEVHPQDEDGCGGLKPEKFTLALGFTSAEDGVRLRSAARTVGEGGALSGLLTRVDSARVIGPERKCALRVRLGPVGTDGSAHAELLLVLERGSLGGVGSWWKSRGGKRCMEAVSVFSTRVDAAPPGWAGFAATVPGLEPAPARPASEALLAVANKLDARALLGGAPVARASVPLRGKLVDYVAAVVEGPKSVRVVEVGCTSSSAGRCVAVVGDPCSAGLPDAGEDCEGMYLTVVVDPATGKLDRADAGGYPVEVQADVEARLEMAP